jgi:hypothetical protein
MYATWSLECNLPHFHLWAHSKFILYHILYHRWYHMLYHIMYHIAPHIVTYDRWCIFMLGDYDWPLTLWHINVWECWLIFNHLTLDFTSSFSPIHEHVNDPSCLFHDHTMELVSLVWLVHVLRVVSFISSLMFVVRTTLILILRLIINLSYMIVSLYITHIYSPSDARVKM